MPFELPEGPCRFCERIARERDDWAPISSDESTISWINPAQFEPGQALVIPKRHAPTLLDLTDDEATALIRHARRLAAAMVAAFDPDGLTLYQNNGVASLQAVPHVHLHVVPRRHGSGWGEGPPHIAALERGARGRPFGDMTTPIDRQRQLAEQLRQHLASAGASA
jgi:histidine triad (HIT) family protein